MSRRNHRTTPIISPTERINMIAAAMRQHGFTDERLAAIVGVDRSQIGRIRQRGYCEALRTPLRIAKAIGVPLEAIAPPDAA